MVANGVFVAATTFVQESHLIVYCVSYLRYRQPGFCQFNGPLLYVSLLSTVLVRRVPKLVNPFPFPAVNHCKLKTQSINCSSSERQETEASFTEIWAPFVQYKIRPR